MIIIGKGDGMPAVSPTRLRFQIQELLVYFSSPGEFHRRLEGLFNSYANLSLRYGEIGQRYPLIPMYHLPDPVLRQLKLDIVPYIQSDPEAALALADELWGDTYFEILQVAVMILDLLPSADPAPILMRLKKWLTPELDPRLASELLSTGTRNLQTKHPQVWESFINAFLDHSDPKMIALGLLGLKEGIQQPAYKNLPTVYRLISPFIQNPQSELINSLQSLIAVMAVRSPIETAFFLKQSLIISESPETMRLIKGCIPLFPDGIQQEMKAMIKR